MCCISYVLGVDEIGPPLFRFGAAARSDQTICEHISFEFFFFFLLFCIVGWRCARIAASIVSDFSVVHFHCEYDVCIECESASANAARAREGELM